MAKNKLERGTVKWFDDKKGFGFIGRENGKADMFVHYSGIEPQKKGDYKTLKEGDLVEFLVEESKITGRDHAVECRVIPAAEGTTA
jgi:CspA family cold shock protein